MRRFRDRDGWVHGFGFSVSCLAYPSSWDDGGLGGWMQRCLYVFRFFFFHLMVIKVVVERKRECERLTPTLFILCPFYLTHIRCICARVTRDGFFF
ncbi:hypothetical protein QBC47DRAFT_375491 [Echria macrotheca]|uniref:Uncharacterized protein n=1 Tax=Echria macrotheca TaxID=438768 RepID=A0AAJ0BI28_9PEZI|nr:hypothetical protein QBC47DRAFT_375491 [Echria macrotheca]